MARGAALMLVDLWSLFRAQLDTSLVTSPRMTPHVKGGEKDEFDNCGTDFHYMFGQVDTWESVTNSDWLMYDTSGASVMGSSAVKLQTHKNYPFTRATHETDWITTDGQGERLETERARDTAAGSNGVLWCAPSQACICQTTRSDSYEQVNQVGTSWGKALAHPVWQFHG